MVQLSKVGGSGRKPFRQQIEYRLHVLGDGPRVKMAFGHKSGNLHGGSQLREPHHILGAYEYSLPE